MLLKNQVEWALHCCTILAALPAETYLSTKALSTFHGVPKEYLSKALQALSQAGLVEGTLGPKGGYRLALPAHKITFLDVVEAVEGKKNSFNCTEIRQNNPCHATSKTAFEKPCAIARVMWQADAAWRETLKGVTLADLNEQLLADLSKEDLERSKDWLLNFS